MKTLHLSSFFLHVHNPPGASLLQSLENEDFLNLEPENTRKCTVCSKKGFKTQKKPKVTKGKIKPSKKGGLETSIADDSRRAIVTQELSTVTSKFENYLPNGNIKASADHKLVTLQELKAGTIKERIEAANKHKIEWKELVTTYLEESVTKTRSQHLNMENRSLNLEQTQAMELIDQLVHEETAQIDFKFGSFFTLSNNYQGENSRKFIQK